MGFLKEELKKYKKISLDTNTFIYLMERHPLYLNSVTEIFKSIETGKLTAITSILLITEILTKPFKDNNKVLQGQYKAFISTFPNLMIRDVDYKICVEAAKIRAIYGLRTPDAIFIATALEEKAEAFVTNDLRLKAVKGIEIIVLGEYSH